MHAYMYPLYTTTLDTDTDEHRETDTYTGAHPQRHAPTSCSRTCTCTITHSHTHAQARAHTHKPLSTTNRGEAPALFFFMAKKILHRVCQFWAFHTRKIHACACAWCTMHLHSTNYHAHVHVHSIPDTVNMHACIRISMSGTSMGETATRNEACVCVCASMSVCLCVCARASVCVFMCVCVPASNVKSVHCLLAGVRVSLRVKFNKGVSARPYTHLHKQKYINTHTNKLTAQARAICVSPSILTVQKVKLSHTNTQFLRAKHMRTYHIHTHAHVRVHTRTCASTRYTHGHVCTSIKKMYCARCARCTHAQNVCTHILEVCVFMEVRMCTHVRG